ERRSNFPLHGLTCRGFQLWAGKARGNTSNVLFEAQCRAPGRWNFGPDAYLHGHYVNQDALRKLYHEREAARHMSEDIYGGSDERERARVEECDRRIEAFYAADLVKAQAHRTKQELRKRIFELARARVLDFIGAPNAQMQLAGRLMGICCICG